MFFFRMLNIELEMCNSSSAPFNNKSNKVIFRMGLKRDDIRFSVLSFHPVVKMMVIETNLLDVQGH